LSAFTEKNTDYIKKGLQGGLMPLQKTIKSINFENSPSNIKTVKLTDWFLSIIEVVLWYGFFYYLLDAIKNPSGL